MSDQEKYNEAFTRLQLALAMQGITIDDILLKQIDRTREVLEQKKGNFDLNSAVAIRVEFDQLRRERVSENTFITMVAV